MQRTFVAITLALTLTCAFGYVSNQTYVKAPIQVVADNETSYTNSSFIGLASVNIGELDVVAFNASLPTGANTSSWNFNAVYRKLDGKTLSGTANTTVAFTGSKSNTFYLNGYAVSVTNDTVNGTQQIVVFQKSISGNNTLATFAISLNNDTNSTPTVFTTAIISKTVYVFYWVNNTQNVSLPSTQLNISSFTVGSTTKGNVFTLTSAYNRTGSPLSVVWGEALGSSQLYANWQEGNDFKYATIDVSKGTVAATTATAWSYTYTCNAFSTDKKYFGDLCFYANTSGTNTSLYSISYFVRFNGTGFLPLNVSNNVSTSTFQEVLPYGPYIAIFYTDSVSNTGNTTYTYDIYNFDTWAIQRNRTQYLIADTKSNVALGRVVSGGIYTLTDSTNAVDNNGTITYYYSNIFVGLVLGSSYLTSVLGFIMTIVAGVLLF